MLNFVLLLEKQLQLRRTKMLTSLNAGVSSLNRFTLLFLFKLDSLSALRVKAPIIYLTYGGSSHQEDTSEKWNVVVADFARRNTPEDGNALMTPQCRRRLLIIAVLHLYLIAALNSIFKFLTSVITWNTFWIVEEGFQDCLVVVLLNYRYYFLHLLCNCLPLFEDIFELTVNLLRSCIQNELNYSLCLDKRSGFHP